MKNRFLQIVKFLFGLLLFLIGLGIFFYPTYREWKTGKIMESIGKEFQQEKMIEDTENEDKSVPNPIPETENLAKTEIPEELQTLFASVADSIQLYQEMEQYNRNLLIEGQTILDAWSFKQNPIDLSGLQSSSGAIGTIELPDIDLKLPLYIGASEENMSKGAVVLGETSMPIGGMNTNCVICAHRGWSGSAYFRDIDQLKAGSRIIIQNPWEKLVYAVTGTEIIHATEIEILNLQEGKDIVTIFSCYPYMSVGTPYRLVIFCERIQEETETMAYVQESEELTVREMIDEELKEKEIVIEETFMEEVSEKEDKARIIVPLICVFLFILILLSRSKNKK